MAEEKNNMQMSPEITKLDKTNPRRKSTGIVKSSTSKRSSQNYLRASTGSCHDFCKYGRQQTFAVQARNPKPKRITPSPGKKKHTESEGVVQKSKPSASNLKPSNVKVQSSKQDLGNAVQGESNKIPQVKLKPSSIDIAHSPEPPEIIKREIILPSKQLNISSKQNSSDAKMMIEKKMKTNPSKYPSGPKSKPLMINPSPSSTTSVGIKGTRNSSRKPGKLLGTCKTTVKKLPAAPSSSVSPTTSKSRAVNLYARKHSSPSMVSPLKDQKRTQKDKLKPDLKKVQEKTLRAVEADKDDKVTEAVQGDSTVQISSSPLLQSLSLSLPDSQFSVSREDVDDKVAEPVQGDSTVQMSSPSVQSLSLSLPDSQFSASHGDVAEESKYIDNDIQQSESTDSEDLEESEYTENEVDEFISEDETVNINEVSKLKGDRYQCVKVTRVIRSGDKDGAMARSKFRKGRTVDLQNVRNVPRKLKFRRGRILGDNDDKHAARRSFEKRELDDDANGASPGSEKVVLRHQDMQGKKDAQGLYNNVIEETASKLVESRKSKVKALVGAFETVISLQESKPSIPTVT
ncbi:uncharacterized protein LOC141718356 isoform X2 [Apium graveolens]